MVDGRSWGSGEWGVTVYGDSVASLHGDKSAEMLGVMAALHSLRPNERGAWKGEFPFQPGLSSVL